MKDTDNDGLYRLLLLLVGVLAYIFRETDLGTKERVEDKLKVLNLQYHMVEQDEMALGKR